MAAAVFNGGGSVQWLRRCPGKEEDSDTLIKLMRRLAAAGSGRQWRRQAATGGYGDRRQQQGQWQQNFRRQ